LTERGNRDPFKEILFIKIRGRRNRWRSSSFWISVPAFCQFSESCNSVLYNSSCCFGWTGSW
jgi:hypothetical protein